MNLIAAHNRRQLLRSLGWLVLSPIGFLVAWWVFRRAPAALAGQWGLKLPVEYARGLAVALLGLVTLAAWRRHRARRAAFDLGATGTWQSKATSAAGEMARRRLNVIAGFVWLVVSLFISGPLCLFRAISAFRERLPHDSGLERRMEALLDELRANDHWTDVARFPDRYEELFTLVRTGNVEFSSAKGRVKAAS